MVSIKPDGMPHAVRVGVALVDGKLWSSGVPSRVRTRYLRRDPRCTLFVFESGSAGPGWRWLALETVVTILGGPDAPEQNLRLFQTMQANIPTPPPEGTVLWEGQPRTEEEFLRIMAEERRLIYEFDVTRSYGMY
jgi:hypothetical protein